jgi:hypothetical protein
MGKLTINNIKKVMSNLLELPFLVIKIQKDIYFYELSQMVLKL